MKRMFVFVFLLISFRCLAVEYLDVQDRVENPYLFGPRIDASMALMYDSFIAANSSYVYGGRGKDSQGDEIFMDAYGDVWRIWHYNAYYTPDNNPRVTWFKNSTDNFRLMEKLPDGTSALQDEQYPPHPRFGHAGIICPSLDNSILHWDSSDTQQETYLNYLVFGGVKQATLDYNDLRIANNSVLTDDLYVFAEYIINAGNGKEKRYHWYKIDRIEGETWPSKRKFAQIVPLFNEQDPPDQRNKFLIFGGLGEDVNGNPEICSDAFIGTFTRTTTIPLANDNEWEFTIEMNVNFEEVTLDTVDLPAITRYGARAVYDPYFYHPTGSEDPVPRVIVMGGISVLGNPSTYSGNVDTFIPNTDWEHFSVNVSGSTLPGMNDSSSGHQRAFFSASMDYRDGQIHVTGGEKSETLTSNEVGILDIKSLTPVWEFTSGSVSGYEFPNVSHHCSTFSFGDTVFCADSWDSTPTRKLYIDRTQKNISKTWDIQKTAKNGLNHPEAATNTRRLGSGDTVYIHQTHDYSGAINDAFECKISVPSRINNVTIEGVVYNGIKPVLYQQYGSALDYNPISNLEEEDAGKYNRDNSSIAFPHGKTTFRNLKFCHFDFEVTDPQTTMPTSIPAAKLSNYSSCQSGSHWDLSSHHADDPAIFMHTECLVENCEFSLNGVGLSMICVSSAGSSAEIRDCVFEDNFIGAVALEKDHWLRYNRFQDNYLTGIAFDKGSRSVACENLFINNGRLPGSYNLDKYQSAILSDFSTTTNVPLIQTPFIFNNTFSSNNRALSVTEFEYRSQYMNRPFFFNNIIDNDSAIKPAIFLADQGGRCDILSLNNCFNLPASIDVIQLESTSMDGVLTQDNLETDPYLYPGDYSISGASACIDQGLFLLEPGILSKMNYPDYGILDIGYHYPLYTGNVPDPPTNLRIENTDELHWNPPTSAPDDYLVIIYPDTGLVTSIITPASSTPHYEFDDSQPHLWLGVMSRNSQQIYSECVWLEWIGE